MQQTTQIYGQVDSQRVASMDISALQQQQQTSSQANLDVNDPLTFVRVNF